MARARVTLAPQPLRPLKRCSSPADFPELYRDLKHKRLSVIVQIYRLEQIRMTLAEW